MSDMGWSRHVADMEDAAVEDWTAQVKFWLPDSYRDYILVVDEDCFTANIEGREYERCKMRGLTEEQLNDPFAVAGHLSDFCRAILADIEECEGMDALCHAQDCIGEDKTPRHPREV